MQAKLAQRNALSFTSSQRAASGGAIIGAVTGVKHSVAVLGGPTGLVVGCAAAVAAMAYLAVAAVSGRKGKKEKR
jgi:hypothetical protein